MAAELHGHLPILLTEDAGERFSVINHGLAALIPAIEAAGGLVEINDSTTVTGLCNAASDGEDVAGRGEPLPIFQVLGERAALPADTVGYVADYGVALAAFRAGEFAEAHTGWSALHQSEGTRAARVMTERTAAILAEET